MMKTVRLFYCHLSTNDGNFTQARGYKFMEY